MSVTSTIAAKKWAAAVKDIQKKSYWVIGLLVVGLSAYFYYNALRKPVAGVLWFLGGFIILYYYWIAWFVLPKLPDPDFNPGATGACPDYLSAIPNDGRLYTPSTPTQYFCVDFIGVSRNGGIQRVTPKELADKINDPSYRFSVDPKRDFATALTKAAFVKRVQDAGLSYSSVGDISLPTMGTNMNGSPAFTGVPMTPSNLTPMSGSGMPPML
jgi:hypothetical protein